MMRKGDVEKNVRRVVSRGGRTRGDVRDAATRKPYLALAIGRADLRHRWFAHARDETGARKCLSWRWR